MAISCAQLQDTSSLCGVDMPVVSEASAITTVAHDMYLWLYFRSYVTRHPSSKSPSLARSRAFCMHAHGNPHRVCLQGCMQ